ncbi:hypothetical protein ACO0QE_000873 [Hanseniaspora vineae]
MSKLFIPTVNVGLAHEADIYCLELSQPFTITAGGDGMLKLWENKILEDQLPEEHVYTLNVNQVGIHHVHYLHYIEPVDQREIFLIACVGFNGSLHLYEFDLTTKEFYNLSDSVKTSGVKDEAGNELGIDFNESFWSVKFVPKDLINEIETHKLVLATVEGSLISYDFEYLSSEQGSSKDEVSHSEFSFKNKQKINTLTKINKSNGFPLALDCNNGRKIITMGFSNGEVLIVEMQTLRTLFNISLSPYPVRNLKVSHDGKLLSIAHDMGSYGRMSLVDTDYGEHLGDYTVATHSATAAGAATTNESLIGFAHNKWVLQNDFNESDEFCISGGLDGKLRVWNTIKRERVSTLNMSNLDIEDETKILAHDEHNNNLDNPGILGCKYIPKNYRGGMGSDSNEGLVVVCLDRSVRWYREAGGI